MSDLTPITRTEMLLDGQDLTPITRKEKFIKHIYDSSQEVPEPITREEWFLNKAASGGGDITVEALNVTDNGTYTAPSGKAYNPVTVEVPDPVLDDITITENGVYTSEHDGFDEVTVEVEPPANSYQLKSITTPASLATFEASAMPMPKLKASIVAKQDLHGYDHPWVGGAGKNKLPLTVDTIKSLNTGGTWNNNTYSINGGTLTIMTDNSGDVVGINVNGTFSAQTDIRLVNSYGSTDTFIGRGSYYINCANIVTETEIHYGYGTSVFGVLNNTSDKGVHITGSNLGMSFVMLRLLSGTQINTTLKPMIRLATESDATFAPYSNICPISGWDAANVSDVGKNLATESSGNNKVVGSVRKGYTYTFSLHNTGTIGFNLKKNNNSGDVVVSSGPASSDETISVTFTPDDNYNLFVNGYGSGGTTYGDNASNYQLELGSTATEYVPYVEPNLYTISLGQTVYGGELDVVNGELKVTSIYFEVSNFDDWYYQEFTNFKALYKNLSELGYPPIRNSENKKVISDKFEYRLGGANYPFGIVSIYPNGIVYFWNNNNVYANKNEMIVAMNSIKPAICYELETPIIVSLTPTLIKSLNGINNLSVDSGEVIEGEYFKALGGN